MTLAPNVTDLNESNLPHNISNNNKIKKKQTILTAAKCTNANSLDDDQIEETPSTTPIDMNKSELIDLKLKQAKLNNNMEDYRQLLELKKELINQKLNDPCLTLKPKKSNELDECINLLSNATSNNTDTDKINKLKDLIKTYATNQAAAAAAVLEDNHQEQESNKSLMSNLNDEFKRNLTDLENKIIEFEKDTGKQLFNKYLTNTKNLTQSTCTQTLIRIVSVLIDYLKHVYNDLNYEKLVHAETSKQLDIHRKLIDGLTNEILSVKEQNEKILKDYSNQQAKFENELDQIKECIFRNNNNNKEPPNIIATRPIAFKSANEIHSMSRPMSCISDNNNSKLNDKFTERLNAMLHSDLDMKTGHHYRPSSTGLFSSANTSQIKSLNDFNYDFNQQMHDLSNKNMQAHQKFKQLQLDHNLIGNHNNNNLNDNATKDSALDKLKQEQELIKEQINILNKQRESAQIELEVLSLTSSSTTNLPKTMNLNHNHNIHKRSNNTPSLSPISLSDNIYSDVSLNF